MSEAINEVVPQGPGAYLMGQGMWEPALVSLEMEYQSHAPEGATRAVLRLLVTDFEDRSEPGLTVEIELTADDLGNIAGVSSAMFTAVQEDDES